MAASPRTYFVNVDFDLTLRPRAAPRVPPARVRQVRELSAQALLGAEGGDVALVRAPIPGEFIDHLAECGTSPPRVLVHPQIDPDSRLVPFGWNAEAEELNRRHRRPVEHPPLALVERVNSRSFGRLLEADLFPDEPASHLVESLSGLEALLARAPSSSAWIVKGEHGNSGLANRRLRRSSLSPADRRFVERLLAEDDRLVVEPWLDRESDGCVVFDVPFDPATPRVHETLCTRDGALIGALFEPGGGQRPWSEPLAAMARAVAARLESEGYFGPVCVDAFTWREGERLRLRALADLNCRRSMSDGAYRWWRRHAAERVLYYRFFGRRKLQLPDELPAAAAALGQRRYDRRRRSGILFASPPSFGEAAERWTPTKLAVIFVAAERSEVFALEHWFRRRFER